MNREHGTETGYQQHRSLSEQACGHCLWAHRLYNQTQRKVKTDRKNNRQAKPREALKPPTRSVKVVLHGTPQALAVHAAERTPVCRLCLDSACDWEHRQAVRYRSAS